MPSNSSGWRSWRIPTPARGRNGRRRRPRSGTARPATESQMQRGDVYLVALDPARGSESDKVRPAVVVSNNAANRTAERNGRGVVTVVPVTSNTDRVYPFQVLLPAGEGGLTADSKAQAEQARSIDYERLRRRVGTVTPAKLGRLDEALRLHLAL